MANIDIDLCNLALVNLGCDQIVSLQNEKASAKLLFLKYEPCLKEVLRAFPWGFARASVKLAVAQEEFFGFDYAYQYPVNCVKVLKLWSDGSREQLKNEESQFGVRVNTAGDSRIIVSDLGEAYADYTRFIDNSDVFDAEFVTAFTYKLAAEIGNAKSANAQLVGEMIQRYQLAINAARSSSATESYNMTVYPTRYSDARSGRFPRGDKYGV
jgi:hypothetical protein